jgi:hypothetical protein
MRSGLPHGLGNEERETGSEASQGATLAQVEAHEVSIPTVSPSSDYSHGLRRYLIVDETASLLKCHDSYFPNLMLGISKYWRNRAVAEIIIDAKVTMDELLEHLKIPLLWDEEGDRKSLLELRHVANAKIASLL